MRRHEATAGAIGVRSRDESVASLFQEHYPELRAVAYALLGDAQAAEEVASDVFVKAFSGWRRFRTVDHAPSYLRRMVINAARGRIRRQRIEWRVNEVAQRSQQPVTHPEPSNVPDPEVLAAIRRLPERQRACVVLRYLEDLSEAEVARILDCSTGTVKSQLSKARAKLQKDLSPEGNSA
jgi:RNA polymerase sigma-70 factor (sigma-E family)